MATESTNCPISSTLLKEIACEDTTSLLNCMIYDIPVARNWNYRNWSRHSPPTLVGSHYFLGGADSAISGWSIGSETLNRWLVQFLWQPQRGLFTQLGEVNEGFLQGGWPNCTIREGQRFLCWKELLEWRWWGKWVECDKVSKRHKKSNRKTLGPRRCIYRQLLVLWLYLSVIWNKKGQSNGCVWCVCGGVDGCVCIKEYTRIY